MIVPLLGCGAFGRSFRQLSASFHMRSTGTCSHPRVMSVVEAGLPLEESELVFRWRLFQSLRMGFATGLAERIAAADVDLHELEDLIGRGCPRGTAYRILRP
jgi:hypothetical protein